MSVAAASPLRTATVVLTGNPNCGKTTVFNALTGLRAKVGNYAGVTVERKQGRLQGVPASQQISILDLPGTYSLSPQSLDEQIARDVLFGRLPEVGRPDLVIVVIDASNLQRHLYFATQVIELGYRVIIALNMMDVALSSGHQVDAEQLARELEAPVVPLVASAGEGIPALRAEILRQLKQTPASARPADWRFCPVSQDVRLALRSLAEALDASVSVCAVPSLAESAVLLADEKGAELSSRRYPAPVIAALERARRDIAAAGHDWRSVLIEARYARAAAIEQAAMTETGNMGETFSDKLDRILTHKFWGMAVFVAIMTLLFQSIFAFAQWPMDLLASVIDAVGNSVSALLPPGDLRSLLVSGVIQGVGAVVVFLPQICLLFLFISLLEDTGYMARAAFLMDRLMSKVGLHGKSFIPMLSSYACAIPGIMATRTIESPKDRLVTILVAPLMSCSARLPVYAVLIAACIPDTRVFGVLRLPGLTMLAMYLLGTGVALLMAWLFKRVLLKGAVPLLLMELPPYKRPVAKVVARHMWERSKLFLRRAGTVILGINILLWFLSSYPRGTEVREAYAAEHARLETSAAGAAAGSPERAVIEERQRILEREEAGALLRQSFAGRLGRAIEPVIAPLGFDWRMGIGIITSFAAREVFVSTMSVVYNVGEDEGSDTSTASLAKVLRDQRHSDGTPVYTPLVAVTLMVFYVFALQCVSTVAVVRRETNSWKWPLFQWLYMTLLAWTLAFATYQGGRLLGWP
jgi:ferrous iron transport protein B